MTLNPHRQYMSARPTPQPCQKHDHGKFEILYRDGAARIGRLHTNLSLIHI